MFVVRRSQHNPIITPDPDTQWGSFATFNGCPIHVGSKTHVLYRAMNKPELFENTNFSLSVIGKAVSTGTGFSNHEQFITPEHEWERYGCEDPRVTKLGKKYYIFYTALSTFPFTAPGIKVAVAISQDMKTIEEKHLVTPFNAKAMTLFPEKINGKYTALLTAYSDQPPSKIAIAQFEKEEDMWSTDYWQEWQKNIDKHILHLRRNSNNSNEQVEVGAPPIRTNHGWLLVYSHINNYNSSQKQFGIEAVLLDFKDPKKIIGRTKGAFLVPETAYEKYGIVPEIVFPSGCLIERDTLKVFYGGADTVCAVAEVRLSDLLRSMLPDEQEYVVRSKKNPILLTTDEPWEKLAVFNPAAIDIDKTVYILYRAMSEDNTSSMGLAISKDGHTITKRFQSPAYIPRTSSEEKRIPNGNSGCEDPRLTRIGNTIYLCYTAYNGIEPPAVAMSTISVKDFVNRVWSWSSPVLLSPVGIDDKDACIVDHVKNGRHLFLHRIHNTISATYIHLTNPDRSEEYSVLLEPRPGMWDSKKVGIAMPPLLTKHGWLLFYHAVSDDGIYRMGVALLDKDDPTKIISRATNFIFEPEKKYELEGIVPNVVFPCGTIVRKDTIYIYYGGGDTVVGVATASLKEIIRMLL